jgi:arginine decarboxylase
MNLSDWTADDAAELYHLDRWGLGYFQVDEDGYVIACPHAHASRSVRICDVVERHIQDGISPPMLIRFPGIIRHRIGEIHRVFAEAMEEFGFKGDYRSLFPVKVNQHQEVIQATIDAHSQFGGGMEAGSKAELFCVIAMSDNQMPILCNGFKDEAIVEMALRAAQMGRNITIVIEKPKEIALIARLAKKLDVTPKLGIRIKLSSQVTGGHWQESTGQRSKFGLSIPELLQGIEGLKQYELLDCLSLLHFHPGSQINNVRRIKSSLIEATRVYVDLVKKGVPLKVIDVGGGLAVDYTGQRNRNPSSMNYTLREYANDVVYYIAQVCDQAEVDHPTIYTESGRAMVAHHSMLVVPVVGTSRTGVKLDRVETISDEDSKIAPLKELFEIRDDLKQSNLLESFHDTQSSLEIALQMFGTGHLSIDQRALAESMARNIYLRINELLEELEFVAPELETLGYQLADTYFANFSVFQALPDSWALKQVFPVMPIHKLAKRPTRFGVIGDLTCDSDGKVDCFIGEGAEKKWLPLHAYAEGEPYWLGIFLVGAYQEALGDDHNLMGKFHTVTVPDIDASTSKAKAGSTLTQVLEHVNHDFDTVLQRLTHSVEAAMAAGRISVEQATQTLDGFKAVSLKYTYLEEASTSVTATNSQLKQTTTT